MGEEGQLDAAERGEDAEEDDDAAMGTGVGEDAPHEAEELEGAEFDVAVFVAGDVGQGWEHGRELSTDLRGLTQIFCLSRICVPV